MVGFHHLYLFVVLGFYNCAASVASPVAYSTLSIDASQTIAETDDNFICATMDWWPHDKCNYNQCPWGHSSVINLNLSNPSIEIAVQAFKSLRIRIGGSLQDQVIYDVGNLSSPCHPFGKMEGGLFGFSHGCLHMNRWDDLNTLFGGSGAVITFGLNALYGRHKIAQDKWGGDWDSSNARDLINYTVARGYPVDSWEFGNELSGSGVGASVAAEQYGKDLAVLRDIVDELYENSLSKPLVLAPGGFFDQEWYTKLLQVSGPGVIDVMTHHIYNLGAGVDPNLVNKILDPDYLSQSSKTFSTIEQTIDTYGPWSSAWVGESGGAYNSGGRNVSNTFINSFWYLDQLGMASKFNTKVYCRQSLVGGNYGLLNSTTFLPNPDYYSALLWHRLMGKGVLAVDGKTPPFMRCYAHCSKGRKGTTMLLINLSNSTRFIAAIHHKIQSADSEERSVDRGTMSFRGLKRTVSFVGERSSKAQSFREEYHLSPKDGYLQTQVMLLNGILLEITEDGEIPDLMPSFVGVDSFVSVNPHSIAFIVFPDLDLPACA